MWGDTDTIVGGETATQWGRGDTDVQTEADSLFDRFNKQLYNVGAAGTLKGLIEVAGIIGQTPHTLVQKIIPGGVETAPIYEAAQRLKERVPTEPISPAVTWPEKIIDTAASIGGFIVQLAATRKLLPKGTSEPVVWETQNLATGGTPGMGALLGGSLGLIGKIPASELAKTSAETALFYSMGKAQGLEGEDLWIQTALPIALRGVGVAKREVKALVTPVTPTPKEVSDIIERVARPPEITPVEAVGAKITAEPTGTAPETTMQKIGRLDTEIGRLRDTGETIPKELLAEREITRKQLLKEGPSFAQVTTKKVGFEAPPQGVPSKGNEVVFNNHKYTVENVFNSTSASGTEQWVTLYSEKEGVHLPVRMSELTNQISLQGVPSAKPVAEYEIKQIKPGPTSPEQPHWNIYKVLPNGKRQIVQTGFATKADAEQLLAKQVPAVAKEGEAPIAQTPEVGSVTSNIPPIETRPSVVEEPPVPPIGRITPRSVPPVGGKKERAFITSVKEEFPDLETRVAGQYLPRSTDKLSIQAKNLIRDNINVAEDYVRKNADDTAIATTCELIKHYNEQAQQATSEAVRNTLYDKAAEITNVQARQLTELGRSVQAASILGRLTPEGQLRFAAKIINDYNEQLAKRPAGILRLQKKIPNLTTEQTKEILTRAKTIQNMPDGAAKAQTWWELQNYISDLVPVPIYRAIINTWKAGLLTGIKTHGLNTVANLSHGVTESVKDIPGVAVDRVSELFTGERTLAFTGRGLSGGIKEGFDRGWQYLKTGYDVRNVGIKYDFRRGSYGKSKFARWVQVYDETVFDMMGAEDQPFYYGGKSHSLYSQAAAKAINQGLKGVGRQSFIDNLVQNPTDEMVKYATIDAETAVFTNQTMLGNIARTIQRLPGGELVVPFGRTPSAIAMQIVNYSPIGIPKTIIQEIARGKFDQRLFSQGMGRAITGTAAMAIGVALYKAGLMTLDRPKSEREQKLWELEGRKEASIRVGGKWRSVIVLGPVGNLLVIGGLFQNALETSGSPTEAIAKTLAGAGKAFTEQTFLQGVQMAVAALEDPANRAEAYFSQLAGSTVPTIVVDTARAMDSVERRAIGPIQKMKGRIPVLREQLEPKVNVFGQDLPRYGGNALEVIIDPTRPVKIKQDVVVDELRRLWDANVKVSPTLLGDKKGYEGLTAEQNTQLWHRAGQLTYFGAFNLIQLPEYRKSTDEEKGKLVESFVDDAKNIARAEVVLEVTNQLSDIPKLIELRTSELLTAEVGQLLALTRMDMSVLTQLSQERTGKKVAP